LAEQIGGFVDGYYGCGLGQAYGEDFGLGAGVVEADGVGPARGGAGAFDLHDLAAELLDVVDNREEVFAGIGGSPAAGAGGGEGFWGVGHGGFSKGQNNE